MTQALVLSMAVSLLVGLALLLAWRREPSLRFSLHLGLSFLWQALTPAGFVLWQSTQAAVHSAGVALLIGAGAASLAALVVGCAGLAQRGFGRRGGWWLFVALVLALGSLLGRGVHWPMAASALMHIAAGALASTWLWPRGGTERAAGLLIVALGLSQFITVAVGLDAAPWQATAAVVLRLALGLCLLDSALRRGAERVRQAQERFVHLVERSHQGVGVQRGETTLYMNPAARRIYGVRNLEEIAARWRNATIPAADRAAARERHRALMSGELAHAEWEADRQRVDGTPLRLRFSAWRIDWDGAPAEQVVVTDVTAEHNALRERLHQATHDELTGLPNRSALLQRLRELTPQLQPFALLVIDLDRFTLINDAHGNSVGDEVLRAMARRLKQAFDADVEVMCLGGDEFALLAVGRAPQQAAGRLVDIVRGALSQPLPAAGQAFHLDASMGIALHPETAADPERLLRAANAAMHQAKHVPGISLQMAEERFERGSGMSLAAEQALRGGLDRREFFLVYQPKVDARGGHLLGFEALARWRHDGRVVSPADFIPAAERTGLIGALGHLVLAEACRQLAAWRNEGLVIVPVAVNVSRWQLREAAFVDQLQALLAAHGLGPHDVEVEVTETAAMNDLDAMRTHLLRLHDAGVALSLDDFGSGLSSLTTLRALPLREVKIDRGLIEPLPQPEAQAVVAAVCTLARALDLRVVAEGVETPAQAEAAAACGCDALQGYWLARPLPADQATGWLRAGRQPAAA